MNSSGISERFDNFLTDCKNHGYRWFTITNNKFNIKIKKLEKYQHTIYSGTRYYLVDENAIVNVMKDLLNLNYGDGVIHDVMHMNDISGIDQIYRGPVPSYSVNVKPFCIYVDPVEHLLLLINKRMKCYNTAESESKEEEKNVMELINLYRSIRHIMLDE